MYKINKQLKTNNQQGQSAIALIDGEHYIPVIEAALEKIAQNYVLKGAVFIGGSEKLKDKSELAQLKVEVILENKPELALLKAINSFNPQVVIDVSDEPILDYRKRFKLASIALRNGVNYRGSDFLFTAPQLKEVLNKKSLGIIGTGKRVGKTAVSAYIARLLKDEFNPVVIAMGRGGPKDPEILEGDKIKLTPSFLLKESKSGKHAASDYYEDALMSRVKTIGCRRAGGGLAGKPFISNVLEGAKLANKLANKLVILEGSGTAIPPVKADKYILIIGTEQNIEDIGGYFCPYRLLMADLAILTMAEEIDTKKDKIKNIETEIKKIRPGLPIIKTVFRPKPLSDIKGKKTMIATTAKTGLNKISSHIEKEYGAQVVAVTNQLSNRFLLKKAIKEAPKFDLMLTELKAAAVDTATKIALSLKKEVVYMDNNLVVLDTKDLDSAVLELLSSITNKAKN